MTLQEKYDKRASLVANMREILDGSKDGAITPEDEKKYDDMEADYQKVEASIRKEESLKKVEDKLSEAFDTDYSPSRINSLDDEQEEGHFSTRKSYVDAFFNGFVRKGINALDRQRSNALQVGTDSEGGYIVPEEFETRIYEILDTLDPVRQNANVITTRSDRNIPIESSTGTFAYVAEEAAYGTSDPAFGRVILESHKSGGIVKVSEELLQDAFFDLPSYLAGLAGRRYNTLEETKYAVGTGSSEPRGVFVPTYSGNVDAAGAAAITTDELIDVFHSLGRAYRTSASWIMADGTVKLIRKLKDDNSQYMWQPGLQAGQPDMLLGKPVLVSDGAPAATTGLVSVVFGDLSFYTIADRLGMTMQRLNELYAANGQIGFKFTKRNDADVIDTNAFTSLTQA